jgi:hypothetical protein
MSDRRVLMFLMAVMLCLNAAIFLALWGRTIKGKNDFPIYYSNAQMVREGKASGLYDFAAENRFTSRVTDVARPPNNHLPYELLLFVPLAGLQFRTAYVLWLLMTLAMLAGVAIAMREFAKFTLALLMIFAFYPVWNCLTMGHDSILMLALFVVSFSLWRRGKDDLAGFVLALCLFRPQIALPFVFIAALGGKWKFVRGFVPGAALVAALSIWVVGLHGMADYTRILLAQGTQKSASGLSDHWQIVPGLMATWRGFLSLSLPRWVPAGARDALLLGGTFFGLAWAAKKLRQANSSMTFDAAFAIAVAVVLLVSFHSYLNDFSLMILPLLIFGRSIASGLAPKKNAFAIGALGLLLFCTPIYLALYAEGSLGWLFAVESIALWLISRAEPTTFPVRVPEPAPIATAEARP